MKRLTLLSHDTSAISISFVILVHLFIIATCREENQRNLNKLLKLANFFFSSKEIRLK